MKFNYFKTDLKVLKEKCKSPEVSIMLELTGLSAKSVSVAI